jgi:N-acetylglucosaminyl-diphospho-decaprenol L-rhamnosyltransferase
MLNPANTTQNHGGVQLSIIIVNWRSVLYLKNCLASIYKAIKEVTFEVLVVDNGSFDGSAEFVRQEYPEIVFMQNDRNLGFAKANNTASLRARGWIFLFLNPDTEIIESPVGRVISFVEENSAVGAVGCRVLNSDRTIQRHYLQAFPTLLNQLLDIDFLRRSFLRSELWGARALYDYIGSPIDVEAISGSCLFVTKSAFEKVGRFSEMYFMYAEDLDLSLKLRNAGYRIAYLGEGEVIHFWGRSSALQDNDHRTEVMERDSVAKYFRVRIGNVHALAYRCMTGVSAILRLSIICAIAIGGGILISRRWVLSVGGKWLRILHWVLKPTKRMHI